MLKETDIQGVKTQLKVLFDAVKIETFFNGLIMQHPYGNSVIVNTMDKGIVNILESDENFNTWKDTIFTLIDKKDDVFQLFMLIDKNWSVLMDDNDYKIWEKLPDEMILYRGISHNHNPKGLSWTKNIETAEWFKNRFKNSDNYMLKANVKKEDMICYLNSRGEDEIVVDTRHIKAEKMK